MNEIWEVLGIAPTGDKRAIRSAYSVLVKQCHPEEDPQGFKRLHEAYQAALAYAAGKVNIIEPAGEKDGEEKPGREEKSSKQQLDIKTRKEEGSKEESKAESKEEPSLLSRLERAGEEELLQSMRSGALMQFSAILNDPKRFRKADAWKAFFLSEDFLREQYQESFADGMMRILKGFSTADNYNITQMPGVFLIELAIAYALSLNTNGNLIEEKSEDFYARGTAAAIWNMQRQEYGIPVGLLLKPENQVRMRSFADYIRLKSYHSRGLLTRQNQKDWEGLFMGGAVNYLYELKGRGEHVVYPETRSVCLLELYCFWIRNEEVPKCILEYIYRQYNLRGVEHTSAKKQYEPLKRAILSCYPDIEEALYGEEGRAKLISNWYREMMRIISDCERFYEEPEEVKGRVAALFSGEDWEKVRYLPELFVKMELQLSGRSVIPSSLAKRLMEHFSDGAGVRERVWEREQGEILAEGMVHSLYYTRMIMDMHGAIPQVTLYFDNGAFKEIYKEEIERYSEAIACQDFWHYFLMRGFGFRGARIAGRDKYRREYMAGMKVILPAYIEYLYQPSLRWQQLLKIPSFCRLFSDEGGEVLPETEFVLPDGKCFRAEFHLHYVRYFLDGREVFEKVYDFMEYAELAKSMDSTEQLIILLAVTKINAGDCVAAQEMVKRLLSGLPLAPVSIPVIARLLTEGEEEIEGGKHRAKTYYPHISMEMAAESIRRGGNGFEGEENGDSSDGRMETGGNSLLGIFYAEDEELCFRAVVGESGFTVYRQNDFGFEQIYSVEFPCGISAQEKQCAAREFLQGLKRPVPALASTVCLEGMTEVEKAQQILSALKQDALYRGSKHGLLPYAPGYPWEEKDTGNALQYFYREYGGYLSECYCVLHFGEDDTQDKKDHVFYCSMKPFGFSLALRALDWLSSYEFREKELRQKVKEKHWVVGHFGWGGLTGPQGEAVPKIIAVGESGTYYYYDVVRLVRKESLAELLARMFDFSKVVSVENYKGELSISRFDGELEYCYGREALLQSVYTPEKTVADIFTIFTKSEMMREFAVFMDGILDGITWELKDLYFEFSAIGDGAYSMRVHRQDIDCLLEDDTTCEDLMGDQKPLVWKIWQRGRNDGEMKRDFKDTIYWYMECGKYGRKLASLKKITAGFDLGEGDELMVCLSCSKDGRKELEWHRNKLDGRNNSGTVWLD